MHQSHTGINITESKIQLVELNYVKGQYILDNVDEEYLNDFLDFENKPTRIVSLLQSAFDQIVLRKPLKNRNISLTLPHSLFKVVYLPCESRLDEKELDKEIRYEISVLYPRLQLDSLIIQNTKIAIKDSDISKVLVFCIQKKYLKIFHDFCQYNDLNLKFVDNVHSASNIHLLRGAAVADDELILSAYASHKHLSVSYIINNSPVYFKIIPLENINAIPRELSREISMKDELKISQAPISRIILTGDDITRLLIDRIISETGYTLEVIRPFERIRVSPALLENKFYSEELSSFAAASGIALRLL